MLIKHEYFCLKSQLCKEWDCDLNQIQQRFRKYNMRIWVFLAKAKVFEVQKDMLTEDDFTALRESIYRASGKKLKELGYTQTINNGSITSSKENVSFIINYKIDKQDVSIIFSNSLAKEVKHDEFLELCEQSFLNPSLKLNDLFNIRDLEIVQLQSDNPEHAHYLDSIYTISLDNCYVHIDEVKRIEALLKMKSTSNKETIEQRDNRLVDRGAELYLASIKKPLIKTIHSLIIDEENGISDITISSLKKTVTGKKIKKTINENVKK